jgi:hypothetical protein
MMELWWAKDCSCLTRCIWLQGDEKCQIWYIINVIFHNYGIDQQIVAWVLSQNIEVALNGMNPRHNILHKQIAWEQILVDDTPNLIDEPTPPKHPHHRCPNMWWTSKIPMKNGPFFVGLPLHLQNPTCVGPKWPLNPVIFYLNFDFKWSLTHVDTLPSPLLDPSLVQVSQTTELFGTRGHAPSFQHWKG